ncbi:PAS domain-containing sensor histidine kinase [Paenibacillus flagellatus]|uniref:histidine kinase n=1 Tax=Paenibacillus flagellatus TaxID=2211139 RepID=A0A2V5KC43_9BACL|nr:PAS domain S-box protein [Paenibacillus flagellatus]PYI56562.1 histidine kinase [Paenibacillus flagellatus]
MHHKDGHAEPYSQDDRRLRDIDDSVKRLAESEAMYRLIADNMTDMVRIVDTHGRSIYASPSHTERLGFTPEQCVDQQLLLKNIHPDDMETVVREFRTMIASKRPHNVQFRLARSDGRYLVLDEHGTPILGDDGEIKYILVVARDVTRRKMAEQTLRESEALYRFVAENMTDLLGIVDKKGTIRYASPSHSNVLGFDGVAMRGTSAFDYVYPDDADAVRMRFAEMVETRANRQMRFRFRHADGRPIHVDCLATPVLGEDGALDRIVVVSRDVTQVVAEIAERRRMERALQVSEERYRRLVELSPIAISVLKDETFAYVNPAGMKLTGAERPDDIIGTSPIDWVHPDDRALAEKLLDSIEADGASPAEEYKIVRKDGKEVDISAMAIYDPRDRSVQIVSEDITNRKRMERALSESEELNRRLIELSPQAIVYHSDFKFRYVNPAAVSLFGARVAGELVGRSIFRFIHPDDCDAVRTRLERVYAETYMPPPAEQRIVRPDGAVIDVEAIVASVPFGGTHAGLTLLRDITERKKAEEAKKRAARRIRESEELHDQLQTSLDRFSHDLLGVMKESEMERRFLIEVRRVMNASDVCLVEADRNRDMLLRRGSLDLWKRMADAIRAHDIVHLPVCGIIDTPDGYFLKIGERRGKSCLLCVGSEPPNGRHAPRAVWLKTISRYVGVLYDNFRVIEDLSNELEQLASRQVAPSWLLRLLFSLSEHERKHLSQDLHDAALQEQIIWYRKLDQLSTDPSVPPDVREQLQPITQGLLDVIYQIRITCNELRPPLLIEEGLVTSLEALFEFMQMRTDYAIEFEASGFRHTLSDELLTGLYRIVQELLANATKHSKATRVAITLHSHPDRIQLTYEDNGVGANLDEADHSFRSMGVFGMKERVRSMDGTMEWHSSPNEGLSIYISVPAALSDGPVNLHEGY